MTNIELRKARVTPAPCIHGKNMNKYLDKIWPQTILQNKANSTVLGPYFCSCFGLACGVWGVQNDSPRTTPILEWPAFLCRWQKRCGIPMIVDQTVTVNWSQAHQAQYGGVCVSCRRSGSDVSVLFQRPRNQVIQVPDIIAIKQSEACMNLKRHHITRGKRIQNLNASYRKILCAKNLQSGNVEDYFSNFLLFLIWSVASPKHQWVLHCRGSSFEFACCEERQR